MVENNHPTPSLKGLARKVLSTGLGAIQNRGELFLVEAQEERERVIRVMVRSISGMFLGMMAILLLTGTVVFLVPAGYRIYAAAGFTLLYFGGSVWCLASLKPLLKQTPFEESVAQLKKDRELLDRVL